MGRCLAVLLACALTCPSPAVAQPAPDGVELLLTRLQTLLQSGASAEFASLVARDVGQPEIEQFTSDLFTADIRRAVIVERDRAPLAGALPGDGYRLVAEMFTETPERARIVTALFDVRRPAAGAPDSWRITAARAASAVDGLFRIRIKPDVQFVARNLTATAEDLLITQAGGPVFLIESEAGITGLILLGRGIMRFTPAPATERGQLRIFAGRETLEAQFDSAFLRLNPLDYEQRVSVGALTPVPVNARDLRRAQEVLAREAPKSFSLDLRELSPDPWYLLPPPGDFLAEVRTRRHGTLTYSRSGTQSEDITLFERDRRRTIALYPSAQRRAAHGLAFNEDDHRDYDVIDYDIEAQVSPENAFLQGRVRMQIRVRSEALSALTLRLSDDLAVRNIVSLEYGRLLHLRVRDHDNVIVNFPVPLPRDTEINLLITYSGQVEPQTIDDEALQSGEAVRDDFVIISAEPNFLLSSRSYWYPQNPIVDYATGTLRVIVPEGYGCVASGLLRTDDDPVTLRDLLTMAEGRSFVFRALNPVRYFALVVSRFDRVAESTLRLAPGEHTSQASAAVRLAVDANPRQQRRGRTMMSDVHSIMGFYAGLMGEAPYGSMTVALVEHELPGGHSPGYFVVLNNQLPTWRSNWRNDPASFTGFPEFFIAHEVAHQWWGQAVGWRNYHDQWLSEGFAQYFAALYAQTARGERVFTDMLRQFSRWAIAESDEGPISLGSRLGHIKRQPRVFRALVYNKAAAVLHMLRRLIGDEAFFEGLRAFYAEHKFRKAGTDDLRAAFEAASGRPLDRFFDQWIYGVAIPELRYRSAVSPGRVAVRFEQTGSAIFDVPVTVSIEYADGRVVDSIVQVSDRQVEWEIATTEPVREVQINGDHAAVAIFDRF